MAEHWTRDHTEDGQHALIATTPWRTTLATVSASVAIPNAGARSAPAATAFQLRERRWRSVLPIAAVLEMLECVLLRDARGVKQETGSTTRAS